MSIDVSALPPGSWERKLELARKKRAQLEERNGSPMILSPEMRADMPDGISLVSAIGSWVSFSIRSDTDTFIDLLHPSGLNGPEVRIEPHRQDKPEAPAGWTYTEFSQITGSKPFDVVVGALAGACVRLVHVHTPDFTKLSISGKVVLTWVSAIVDDSNQLLGQINFTVQKVKGGLYQTSRMQYHGSTDSALPLKLKNVADLKSKMKGWLSNGLVLVKLP